MLSGRDPLPVMLPRRAELDVRVAREVIGWAEAGLDRRLAEADWLSDGWIAVVDEAAEDARRNITQAKDAGDDATVQWWAYVLLHLSYLMKYHAERLGLDLVALEQAYFDYVDAQCRRPETLLTMTCKRRRLKVETQELLAPVDLSDLGL